MRILVAEDEKNLNEIVAKELRQNGYTVDACFDGQAALDYCACAEYDALILDIMMPKLDGLAVVRSLRQRDCRVPVLFLTARDSIEDRVTGLDAGADDYLVKPFALDELIRNQNIVLSREKIEQHVWNYDYAGGSNLVDVYIRALRKKLDTDYPNKLIHTVRGAGYVLREGL